LGLKWQQNQLLWARDMLSNESVQFARGNANLSQVQVYTQRSNFSDKAINPMKNSFLLT